MRELTLPAPLMLLPGLGADGDLFGPQREAFGDAVSTPGWIAPSDRNENMAHYARRWAETLNEHIATFRTDRPWFLGGMSMGGMLALELVPFLDRKPAAVFLISSCRRASALPRRVKWAANLATPLKAKQVKMVIKLGAIPFGVVDGQDDLGFRLLQSMAGKADPDFLEWGIGAVADWTYPGLPDTLDDGESFPPVFQMHGRGDRLLPVQEGDCDHVVDNGRHLLNLSHTTTVNRWLFDHITDVCGIDESNEPRVEDPDVTVGRRPELAARF